MHFSGSSRCKFIHNSAPAFLVPGFSFNILSARPKLSDEILGHGDFTYRVEKGWGDLDPAKTPVKNCHDVCVDDDKNLYICQWNAEKTYPIKLHRV